MRVYTRPPPRGQTSLAFAISTSGAERSRPYVGAVPREDEKRVDELRDVHDERVTDFVRNRERPAESSTERADCRLIFRPNERRWPRYDFSNFRRRRPGETVRNLNEYARVNNFISSA